MVLIMKNFSWKIFGDTCEYGHISLGLAGPILWTLVARPQDIEKSKAYPYAYGFGESKFGLLPVEYLRVSGCFELSNLSGTIMSS